MGDSHSSKRQLELQELVSTKGAAKFLGVSVRTIQNYRKAGILTPQAFGEDFSAFYTKGQLVDGAKRWLEGGETILKKQPKTAQFFQKVVKRYSCNENVQVYSIMNRIVPNFKLCKTSSVLTDDKYARMVVDGKKRKVVEKKNHKKFGDIRTVYSISNADGFDNTDPLTVFDYDVLSVCSSNICVGNFDITSAIIYRGLTGKVKNGSDAKPTKSLREAIFNSITKLMGTIIDIDETAIKSAFHYGKDRPSITRSAILPCKYTKKTINGQETDVIHFDREPPFMTIARDRKQILTYDASLLDAPGIRNTLMNIMLKNYVMRRVVEIKSHNQLKPILKFDTIFKYCRLENASRKTKMDARETIVKFFEHLQAKGFIKSFELTKKNNAFYSITFKH